MPWSSLVTFQNFFFRGGRHVAVKIVKNVDRYTEAARSEIKVLEHINKSDPNNIL